MGRPTGGRPGSGRRFGAAGTWALPPDRQGAALGLPRPAAWCDTGRCPGRGAAAVSGLAASVGAWPGVCSSSWTRPGAGLEMGVRSGARGD